MKTVPLTQGFVASVDNSDYKEVAKYKWCIRRDSRGEVRYAVRRCGRTFMSMHRFIISPPVGMEVDHIDGNGLNNQRSNLRICTRLENGRNHKRVRVDNTSGHRGIDIQNGKYRARITVGGATIHIGCFHAFADAVQAYNGAAIKYFGEFYTEVSLKQLSATEGGVIPTTGVSRRG